VLKRLHAWLSETVLPKSTNLGNAVRYALGHWDELTRFADDPAVPLDNNATERDYLRAAIVARRQGLTLLPADCVDNAA
jgi:transposase